MAKVPSAFWDDVAKDLDDPELRHHFILESERIAALDRMINQLDESRANLGLTKADLARSIERTPETVRRLLTAKSVNPQFVVIAEMAAALGFRVILEPMTDAENRRVAQPLRSLVASKSAANI